MSGLRLAGCLAAASVVVWAGCNRTQTVEGTGGAYREVTSPSSEMIARGGAPISDVPVPLGFELDESRSRNFAAGGMRYVDHVFTGSGERFAVARFYKRQMPISRWVLVTDMFVQGENILDFEKDTERCRIIVGRGSLFHPTLIKVQLWTSGRIDTSGRETKGTARR
jgi:hypothetical protein